MFPLNILETSQNNIVSCHVEVSPCFKVLRLPVFLCNLAVSQKNEPEINRLSRSTTTMDTYIPVDNYTSSAKELAHSAPTKKLSKRQRQLRNKKRKGSRPYKAFNSCHPTSRDNFKEDPTLVESEPVEPAPVESTPVEPAPVESTPRFSLEESASAVIDVCFTCGLTLFGSYVRDHMLRLPFDYSVSDIDIFSDSIKSGEFSESLSRRDIVLVPDVNNTSTGKYTHHKSFTVEHFLINCSNGILKLDFVYSSSETSLEPPFNVLDFECNSFIWNKHGIRLGRSTGCFLDSLPPREKKEKEMEIIASGRFKVTNYVPFNHRGRIMSPMNVYWRKSRVYRISKMLLRGWTISNLDFVSLCTRSSSTFCLRCSESLTNDCLKLNCCGSYFHPDCFVSFACDILSNFPCIKCTNCGSMSHV